MCFISFFFFQKAENNRSKKANRPEFCNISFLLLLKVRLVRPVDKLTWSCLMIFFKIKF